MQCLQPTRVIVSIYEEPHVLAELLMTLVVVAFNSRFFEGAVHPLDLAIGPGMVRLGKPVFDVVLKTDLIETVNPKTGGPSVAVSWQVSELDAEGEVLDVLVQSRRDTAAACKLMRKLLKKHAMVPDEWVTDRYAAYGAAFKNLGLTASMHISAKRMNNRAESSHVPVRRREWKLQGFQSPRSAQRFLSMHAAADNTFTIPRHLTTARTHRLLRAEALSAWREAAGLAA